MNKAINPAQLYEKVVGLLDTNGAEYKLFTHREALTWQELTAVQKETGFFGTELKCMVMKVDPEFIVYITTAGQRINLKNIKHHLKVRKVSLASATDLADHFGAQPGCAYPFGFAKEHKIFVDPQIFTHEWLLFSPVLPSKTAQVKGASLKTVFSNLENQVTEVTNFNG